MAEPKPTAHDRLALRERPTNRPIMHQNWGKLLFIHWPIESTLLRPLIPPGLEIDLFEESAWIAIAPFTMWDIRALPPFIPAVPGVSAMHELNVRTYVHHAGIPGVWFFSLDINSALAVLAARTFFFLPYYKAEIDLDRHDRRVDYTLVRTDKPAAEFRASWEIGASLPVSEVGSLEFFLTERYCLYSEHVGSLYRARIHHQPWPLQSAQLLKFDSTMIEALGLETPEGEPLLHYAAEVNVDIWPLEKVS